MQENESDQSFCCPHKTYLSLIVVLMYEPRCEKTGLRGFQPGPTQTALYGHRIWLEA